MARLGILKPLRGTETSLANVVLEEGELAFTYPSTGPGTGAGGIKMGDGTSTFGELDWYISGNDSPTPSWEYDEGVGEAELLNNIKHPEYEQLGKIYYIQSYMNNGSQYGQVTPTIQQVIPYKVIGINHDGTTNTVDLMSCVAVNYLKWSSSYNSWSYGKYSTSNLYNWLPNTCANGYRDNIQAKMCNMTERWREATGNAIGSLQSRTTKVKLLNPVELFGASAATYDPGWEYASSSDHKTKFTTDNYGTQYSIWSNSIGALTSRKVYHNKDMNTASIYWTNSWLASTSSNNAYCFDADTDGSCNYKSVGDSRGIAPVIRLSDSPE